MNHKKLLAKPTVMLYMQILGINTANLAVCELSTRFQLEMKKVVDKLVSYPTIAAEIYNTIKTGLSKIEFATQLSEEQFRYVTNLETGCTKLIACAGSGKTRSVLARIKFMVEHGLAERDEVYAITFSESAALDFRVKIKELFPNYDEFCRLTNLSTIDSLAKSVLCRVRAHKSENVSILSAAFRNYLSDLTTTTDIQALLAIKNIKHLFIDEAQDLNKAQYEIGLYLHEKCGTVVHMIGDPNQNIYQFRSSSSSYLINYKALQFDLSLNYRSTQEIIDFSNCFKQIQTKLSVSATQRTGNPVVVMTKPSQYIHDLILKFVRLYEKECDISEIAFICPTRGTGTYNTVGLSVLFNLFKINGIPINQLYSETGVGDERHKREGKIPGHVNLLTYHGTKGLEFNVVFVMDFYHNLFNIKPTDLEHENHRYLLYVAASRARDLMYVCTYSNTHDGYLNHWVAKVPPPYYFTDSPPKIPVLSFRQHEQPSIQGITELISELPDTKLDQIHDFIKVSESSTSMTRRIYADFTHTDRGRDEALFGTFVEELFYLQHHLTRSISPRELPMIDMLIQSRMVVIESAADYKILKKFVTDNHLTWEQFDFTRDTIPDHIRKLIESNFSREHELNNCVLCTNEFVQIIQFNLDDIRQSYNRYRNPESYAHDYKQILIDFFYLIVVQYAYDNNHYFYINNHGADKQALLQSGAELFEAINTYVTHNYLTCKLNIKVRVNYPKLNLCGEMDFIETHSNPLSETITEIKCVKEISFTYYIQLLLYNFCYYHKQSGQSASTHGKQPRKAKLFTNKFKILNLLTGLEHYLILSISPANLFNLLIILAETGNLLFRDLNLVCDLETTGLIQSRGPLDYKPTEAFRTSIHRRGYKYFTTTYPEIIEIAIKDYDTHMILLHALVKPDKLMSMDPEIIALTGIQQSMLTDRPNITAIKAICERKMARFINCRLLAHNGSRFDGNLMVYDKLIDPQRITILDTVSLIPIHLPPHIRLESKSLSYIYSTLFGSELRGHRAMVDVDALIKIMHHLRIEF
ncbi:ATP-dependent DNA helicase [uncultured virus]|nr:ATP-dependent DNA helicase [uncultured virus]